MCGEMFQSHGAYGIHLQVKLKINQRWCTPSMFSIHFEVSFLFPPVFAREKKTHPTSSCLLSPQFPQKRHNSCHGTDFTPCIKTKLWLHFDTSTAEQSETSDVTLLTSQSWLSPDGEKMVRGKEWRKDDDSYLANEPRKKKLSMKSWLFSKVSLQWFIVSKQPGFFHCSNEMSW